MAMQEAKLNEFMGRFVGDLGAMRSGLGPGWHEHDAALFHGTERFFRPGLQAQRTPLLLPRSLLEENLNPVGRIFYSASTFVCTPASCSQDVGACLGAQAGEARLREVATQGGFRRFRRATQTPFNLVLEARP